MKLVGVFILIFISFSSYSKTLKIAYIDWCPQLCVGEKSEGYIIDTVKIIFKDSEYKLEFEKFPWSRAINNVRSGNYDALLSPAKKEAPDLIYPDNEVGVQKMCFFVRKDSNWVFNGLNSLEGLRVGGIIDSGFDEEFEFINETGGNFELMPYNGEYLNQSFLKLDNDRIDVFMFTLNTTLYEMKKRNKEYKDAGCLTRDKIYMAFSPKFTTKSPVIRYFDKNMARLKSSNTISEIMKKYGLNNWNTH
ncbi:substrate-binding periplasmic protein [Vibrio marisflavi]|uniref:Solute-binding protein family 3/N-terminal domain-containing protein n=1 Tax=Vibrio marisflavi CECT 7928 TaxID=634439 RepID=A0ABN8E013_9VIBR|nr:transporter substrate-binding domain-containing protein [Vibrio marisflavi]CAH0536329.1 hypothetical protein VMF7928_00341 [Vibrio marisflavi CECT 7928]